MLDLGPAVVGATGGSGTRAVARILRGAGLFIGTELNESEDAWKFGGYSDRWIDVCLSHRERGLPEDVEHAMLADLEALLAEHCAPLESLSRRWGWKEPRSIYLLPFFDRHLPALRFLHIVRDGRDMALSANQNQLRKHGAAAPIPTGLPPAVRSIALWAWINLEAARYGEAQLGGRYLRIRYEDLCTRPVDIARTLLTFLEIDSDPSLALDIVVSPGSLGRWRDRDPALISELEAVGGQALVAFGYEPRYS